MATSELRTAARGTWILGNPWFWLPAGLGLCAIAWPLVLAESLEPVRVCLVFLGLLAAGGGIAIRLNSAQPVFLDHISPSLRGLLLGGLAVMFALMALALTLLFLFGLLGRDLVSWRAGQLFFLWLVVTPLSIVASGFCIARLKRGANFSRAEETAVLLFLAALATFCACRALYDPLDPGAWDSIRLFLAILTLVCTGAVPLALLPQSLQRLFISLLIVIHFGGIVTAALSAPPSPWIIGQVWGRLYRPYLEFMYLNNAYHFYAPEPGPASHLWFRLFYEDPERKLHATWYKIPDVDEHGQYSNVVALEYQRILALTENTVPTEPTPNTAELDVNGMQVPARWLARRYERVPGQLNIGESPRDVLKIPFHPEINPHISQYLRPNSQSRDLLSSYARKVCRMPHPDHPDWTIKSVKIYRVVHMIPQMELFANAFGRKGMDATDPVFYRPFFMGEFDLEGNLMDPDEPFLYWLLPVLRYTDDPTSSIDKFSNVKNFALLHAQDPVWIFEYSPLQNRWLPLKSQGKKVP